VEINVNGQSYDRWEDVPAELRQQLAATLPDADKNGVPDLFEGNLSGLPQGAQTFSSTSIVVNGKPVQSAAELPPEVQAQLQKALGLLGPMSGAAPTPSAPGAIPPSTPGPLQPGEVMLNGVPTAVGDAAPAKKSFWRRLFGG
jgi:hypothetical protein